MWVEVSCSWHGTEIALVAVVLRRQALVLFCAVLAGCAHGAAHRAGDERLTGVNFEGNEQLSDKTLLTGLALHRVLKRSGTADPYLVQVDADRIRGEYVRRGYIDVDVRSRVERKGDDATVIYTVEEGPRAKTRTVIRGLPDDVPRDKVREQLPLEDGQPFDYDVYDVAKPKLLGVLQDAGYAHAQLEANVVADRAAHTAIVELFYISGPKSKFGKVEVTGATGDLAEAAANRVEFSTGQTYSAQALVQTQRNLYGFGRFSTVQITPDKSAGPVVNVKVEVAESARHEITFGGGFGIDPINYEIRGRAGYSIAGWPFDLDTVSIDLRPAYAVSHDFTTYEPRIRALAKLERADLLWTYTKGTVEAGYNYLAYEAYTSSGPLARLGFETRLGTERVRLRVGWGLEQVSFPIVDRVIKDHMDIVDALGLTHDQRIGGYQQALIIDLRNNPIEPTLGAYAELHTTEGTKYAGGQYEYFQMVPDVRAYLPLLFGAVLAGHAKFGGIYGDVPATERFFSGGTNSQRGFAERKLSPSITGPNEDKNNDVETVPYGGAGLIDTSVEARIPITMIKSMLLGTAVFLDGGDVTESVSQLDPWNLYWAIGAGLRLQTIVGPVRFDVGYRLNRVGNGERDPAPGSHWAYHLTIGEAF
jgi:outer membrane protein assembly factor BamA